MATTAVLNLKLDTRQFEQAEKKVSAGMGRMKVKALAAVAAVAAVGKAAQVSVKNFMAQEDAVNSVASSLANAGESVRKYLPDFAKYAAEIQQQTIYGDELVLSQMAYGKNLGITADKLKEATTAAIGLASKYRIDLKTSMMLVGRANLGQTQMLTRYGIVLKEGATDQEKFNELLKIGADNFSLATDEAKTNSGQLKQAQNNWGDLTESIGEFLVKTIKLPKLLGHLNKGITAMSSIMSGAITISKQLSNIIVGGLTTAFIRMQASIQESALRIKTFFEDTYDKAKKTIALMKGDAEEAYKIQQRIASRDETVEKTIAGITEDKTKKILSISNEIAKRNKKLAEDYNREMSDVGVSSVVKDAIKKFEGREAQITTGLADTGATAGDTTATPQKRQEQFAGAFEKGSVEAYRIEKSSQGNKTERQQLDVLRKIEKKDPVQITNNGII